MGRSKPHMKDMNSRISKARVKCAPQVGENLYVPADKLQEILTRPNVEAVLREQNLRHTSDLTGFVMSRARTMFLGLVWTKQVEDLAELKSAGVDDAFLPIGQHVGAEKVSSLDKTTSALTNDPIPVLSGWDPSEIDSFVNFHWGFQVPTFSRYKFLKLNLNCPLPLRIPTRHHHAITYSGSSAEVHQLELLDNSWRGPGDNQPRAEPQLVAVKKFFPTFKKYFGIEQENMGRIAHLRPRHDHILQALGAFERGSECHVIFPWAKGGNLNEFWQKTNAVPQDARSSGPLVLWCLKQMLGIADALLVLHRQGYRHGDLKPENLLHVKDGRDLGRLVVADFGLAKLHLINTMKREDPSTSWHATFKYEPPDVLEHRDSPRSRQFDVWSAGCCFLEFATWLGGGWSRLQDFRNSEAFDKFWQKEEGKDPKVHRRVQKEMSLILRYAGTSATKDIVKLVQDRLLKVQFSQAAKLEDEPIDMRLRATSKEAKDRLQKVFDTARRDESYCVGRRLPPRRGAGHNQVGQPSIQQETYRVEQIADLVDSWEAFPDNEFARALFRRPGWVPPAPPSIAVTAKCGKCSGIDFLSPRSEIHFDQDHLKQESGKCNICAVIVEALSCLGWTEQRGTIYRVGSEFRISSYKGKESLVLSFYADPATPTQDVEEIAQVGYPDLSPMGSPQQYELIRAWRDTCDKDHHWCYPWKEADELPSMPTRVIDVGTTAESALRLVETTDKQLKAKYVALSHCWGQSTDEENFCTTSGTIESNKENIPFRLLPKSFRDAVTVTREIGVRYLWIDSICIIQGDDGDWAAEAQKMGDVFGFAYCTLAASSAKSSTEGFLGPEDPELRIPRISRKTATVTTPDGSHLYLCRSIDNFRDDVEDSVLASRGWVFQERALSRRTIHFTSTQLYWECGQGVHCETLTRLVNTKANLMGDAEFPKYVLDYFKGGQIVLFQYLYQLYSTRDFSHDSDRAVALRGLEDRLGETIGTGAEFGVIGKFPQRSLLWKRASPRQQLSRIEQPADTLVPSWSWMAYTGAIEYLEVPMKSTDWSFENVTIPPEWNVRPSERQGHRVAQIEAVAFGLDVDMMWWKKGITMDGDDNASPDFGVLRCVVVGVERDPDGTEDETEKEHAGKIDLDGKIQYVLIVKPLPGSAGDRYERVGVGGLPATKIRKNDRMDIVLV
ncbi:hypothetical protein PG985_008112 [Apiospora marii]|uniref:Protein kinase domain-containing protein n=1 Tax=Apiospora marii TaxID=335849 RepID=A0ABR1R9S7_9PEZI